MALNPWLLGRHITTLTARVQTLNELTGALANSGGGSPTVDDLANLTLAGVVDEIRLTSNRETENISPVNSQFSHAVPLKVGTGFVVSEVMRSSVAGCLLANIYLNGVTNYVFFTLLRGSHTWSGTCLMTGYNETIVRGKNVAQLTLAPVDNNDVLYA